MSIVACAEMLERLETEKVNYRSFCGQLVVN